MRLKIEFEMDGSVTLPYSYRRGIHAFIYSALGAQDSEELHNMKNGEIKPFVFSDIKGHYQTNEHGIIFEGNCVLYIASPFFDILNDIYNFCIENKYISLLSNYLPIKKISQVKYKEFSGPISYRTLSPITIYETDQDGKIIYYSPTENIFKKKVKENLAKKYELLYGYEMNEYLNIYKIDDIRKQIINFKSFNYEAYHMTFTADCKNEIHTLIMDMGLGYRNPIGLGMIEYN